MDILHKIRQLALKVGIEVNRYNSAQSLQARMINLLAHHKIDTVLDIGANDGGYGRLLRDIGYQGNILSFEPLTDAHKALLVAASYDEKWHVAPRMALGAKKGVVEINVAGNSTSSSILPMLRPHRLAAPHSSYIGIDHTPLNRLDSVEHPVINQGKSVFLKIDTQGYEMSVLDGAESILPRLKGIQIELSLVPLYDGQVLFRELIDWLYRRGFELWNVVPGFIDQTSGRMLQMDGIFFRSSKDAI